MSSPSFECPRCAHVSTLPSDVRAGYCPECRWWTGDSLLGSDDVMRQNEIDGPLSISSSIAEELADALELSRQRAVLEADWFADDPVDAARYAWLGVRRAELEHHVGRLERRSGDWYGGTTPPARLRARARELGLAILAAAPYPRPRGR